jgi:hypothetical protein
MDSSRVAGLKAQGGKVLLDKGQKYSFQPRGAKLAVSKFTDDNGVAVEREVLRMTLVAVGHPDKEPIMVSLYTPDMQYDSEEKYIERLIQLKGALVTYEVPIDDNDTYVADDFNKAEPKELEVYGYVRQRDGQDVRNVRWPTSGF